MAEHSSDPPIRASVVDSGWEPEAPKGRELPRYEDSPRDLIITRVDDQIQSRIAAMNAPERQSDATVVERAPIPVPPVLLPPLDERTSVDKQRFASSQPPPAGDYFEQLAAAPSLGEALRARVRVAGGQVPLWATIVPVLLLTALAAALLGGVLGGGSAPSAANREGDDRAPNEGASSASPSATAAASAPGEPARVAPLSRAALQTLEKKNAKELGTDEALSIVAAKKQYARDDVRALSARLSADPGLAKDPAVVSSLLAFSHEPETAQEALAAMARLPGPLSADLLYEVWTGTAERSDATELARTLLLGRDVRPKASPALSVALELREAESCEDSAKLLARATELGDKRSLAPVTRLFRKTGCGPGKRQDCYPCLREGDALKNALVAVKKRREPELGSR